jgi:hypothetical protein
MTKLTPHDVRRIAVEARRDPRSVHSVLAGTAKDLTTLAVREAAARLGIDIGEPLPVT